MGSAGYRYAENILQLHTPQSRRAFVRIDAVHALQNDALLAKFEDDTRGMHTRDAWFYPYPGDDVDAVTKVGFSALEGSPMRFGLYFLDGKLAGGRGPTLKMVLCKIAPGRSCVKAEEDVGGFFKSPPGYTSLYVPGGAANEKPAIEDGSAEMADQAANDPTAPATTSVFNDCYVLFNNENAIPTHVVSYHLEVDEGAMADKVNETTHWMECYVPHTVHWWGWLEPWAVLLSTVWCGTEKTVTVTVLYVDSAFLLACHLDPSGTHSVGE